MLVCTSTTQTMLITYKSFQAKCLCWNVAYASHKYTVEKQWKWFHNLTFIVRQFPVMCSCVCVCICMFVYILLWLRGNFPSRKLLHNKIVHEIMHNFMKMFRVCPFQVIVACELSDYMMSKPYHMSFLIVLRCCCFFLVRSVRSFGSFQRRIWRESLAAYIFAYIFACHIIIKSHWTDDDLFNAETHILRGYIIIIDLLSNSNSPHMSVLMFQCPFLIDAWTSFLVTHKRTPFFAFAFPI